MNLLWWWGTALRRAVVGLFALALAVFILAPLLIMILRSFARSWFPPALLPQAYSFQWWSYVFSQANLASAVSLTFSIAPVVVLVSAMICFPAAYAFARIEFPLKRGLLLSFLAANAFPQSALYVSIAVLFYRLGLISTFWGVVLIHVVRTLVFMIWIPTAAFKGIDPSMEEAARDAGASRLRVFFQITLPMAVPGLLVACLFAALASLEEAQGTLLVGIPKYKTIPIVLYSVVASYPLSVGAVISLLLFAPSLLLLLVAQRYLRAGYLAAGYSL